MHNIIIRRAKKKDCPRLLEFVNELAKFQQAEKEVTISFKHFEGSGFGENPVWWGFVADVDGEIQGMAIYYIRFSTWKGKQLYLEDLYISEKMRRTGIGTLLFEQLIIEVKEKELNGIAWQVAEWNESAIQFYKKCHADFNPQKIDCYLDLHR